MGSRSARRGLLLAVALVTTSSAALCAPTDEPAKPGAEPLGEGDLEALGRREAARMAAGRTEVSVSASADVGSRHFEYSDPVGPMPAAYRLPIAPMASF